ncbi:MAG TPA: cytochrome B6 [Nitrospiraceae bacterium]|jgi:ubiquinol-cytochrome c reductase cytochrome b subunit|nr:cytochrome B6 [Nitrospiraceae bacterium]
MAHKFKDWLEVRIGLNDLIRTQLTEYRVPKNINILYTLGFIALAGYIIQVVSGIFLLIYYIPHPEYAFKSVQNIMNRVPYGWLFRQIHVVGSNLLIAAVILHMLTTFLMGNYKKPRELTWIGGGLMLLITLAFGLSGYLLPWSQLSYWATTVTTSAPTAFPYLGDFVTKLLRGSDNVSGITLSRFFALHVAILPPLFLALMVLHIFLIRRIGISATPFGVTDEEKRPLTQYIKKTHPDGYPFYPDFFRKEMLMVMAYFTVMFAIITFLSTLFLPEEANTPADPFETPAHIRPEWYFLAPYQMLKLVPNKFLGISLQIILIGVFLLWPFLDTYKEKNLWKRPVLRGIFLLFLAFWVVLMFWGRY